MERLTKAVEAPGVSRRRFLGYAGALAGAGMITLQACKKDDDNPVVDNGVNLGSGDVGILNYAYALEQLEAAFYTRVISSQFSGITAAEVALLTDIRDHEIAHRNFFKAAITAAGATPIQDLEVDFSSINFGDRASVLGTAKTFEDLGVAAYNGAGKLIQNADYLTIAGKIVSVEARHAAYIRDLLSNGSFADLGSLSAFGAVDAKGLDAAQTPAQVLAAADTFIATKLNGSNLPTS
jgi:hypothetical protein